MPKINKDSHGSDNHMAIFYYNKTLLIYHFL